MANEVTFGQIGNEFINLYSKENPILEAGDDCYFLFTNDDDFHRPMIGKGYVYEDRFNDGMNKEYFVILLEILENEKVKNEFALGQTFSLYPIIDERRTPKKLVQMNHVFESSKNLFKIEAFFIRDSIEKIKKLRSSYISMLKKDIIKQLEDIENIVDSEIIETTQI